MDPCVPKAQHGPAREKGAPLGPEARGDDAHRRRRVGRTQNKKRWSIDRGIRVHVDVGAHVGDRIMEADATELSPNPLQLAGTSRPAQWSGAALQSCTSVCLPRYDAPSVCFFFLTRSTNARQGSTIF